MRGGRSGRTGSSSSEFGAATGITGALMPFTVAEKAWLVGGVGASSSVVDAATGTVVRMEGTFLIFL